MDNREERAIKARNNAPSHDISPEKVKRCVVSYESAE